MTTSGGVRAHQLRRMKRALRREVRARRDALTEGERTSRSLAIAERLLAMPELAGANTVMAFWSFGSEVETEPLVRRLVASGHRVVLPRIEDGELVPVPYRLGDPVTETPFGAKEPSGGEVVDPAEIDVVIVPGIAFDRHGNRTGYGGGYYDRLFRRMGRRAPRIGVAFAVQLVDEVPAGRGDQRVDVVVTEDEEIRCGGR